MENIIEDYDEQSVTELRDQLAELDATQLSTLEEYEEQNKDRVTLHDAIEQERKRRQLEGDQEEEQDGGDDTTDEEDEGERTETVERSSEDEGVESGDGTTDGRDSTNEGGTRDVQIRVPAGYVAGHHFDDPGVVTVERDRRVETAIENGDVEVVD